MNKFVLLLVTAIAVSLTTGCATGSKKFSPSKTKSLQIGASTMSEAVTVLGRPMTDRRLTGDEAIRTIEHLTNSVVDPADISKFSIDAEYRLFSYSKRTSYRGPLRLASSLTMGALSSVSSLIPTSSRIQSGHLLFDSKGVLLAVY